MEELLIQFWIWLGKTPEQYANEGVAQIDGSEECDFPYFSKLIKHAQDIVKNNLRFDESIDELLTVMALDNESESLLEYIEEYSSNEQLEQIIQLGLIHLQSEARWQIAELLYRRKPKNYRQYLSELACDSHWYVRKRANNCIELLKEEGLWQD